MLALQSESLPLNPPRAVQCSSAGCESEAHTSTSAAEVDLETLEGSGLTECLAAYLHLGGFEVRPSNRGRAHLQQNVDVGMSQFWFGA